MATSSPSSFLPGDVDNIKQDARPLRTDQIVVAVETMLMSLGLPVVETHARYSKGAQGLIFSVSLAEPKPIQVLAAVEPMVARRVNIGRAMAWRTYVYWRYQLPVPGQLQATNQNQAEQKS